MVRGLVVLGGSSHPQLTETICNHLGIPPGKALLSKFAVGETRVEIQESVRGKDVFIIQSGGGKVNDHLMEMLIMVSACKTASAKRITVILPLFPYSRQSDVPYNKTGAPLTRGPPQMKPDYSFNSRPQTPHHDKVNGVNGNHGVNGEKPHKSFSKMQLEDFSNGITPKRKDTLDSMKSEKSDEKDNPAGDKLRHSQSFSSLQVNGVGTEAGSHSKTQHSTQPPPFEPQPGYKQWVAQAGTLVADLVTCAGADHVITMDLHDPQYQGFFDIPVDNLYGRHLLRKYIEKIPNYQRAVIVSPDAGGAKRATAIADQLGMPFALIHKVQLCSHFHIIRYSHEISRSAAQRRSQIGKMPR